jgi:hypothetical protein
MKPPGDFSDKNPKGDGRMTLKWILQRQLVDGE